MADLNKLGKTTEAVKAEQKPVQQEAAKKPSFAEREVIREALEANKEPSRA